MALPGQASAELLSRGSRVKSDRKNAKERGDRRSGRAQVRHGLIEQTNDPHDTRGYVLFVTAAGRKKLATLRPGVEGVERIVTAALTPQESSELRRNSDRARCNDAMRQSLQRAIFRSRAFPHHYRRRNLLHPLRRLFTHALPSAPRARLPPRLFSLTFT
jgi:hypothetical protein